jgi:hypothetical protein
MINNTYPDALVYDNYLSERIDSNDKILRLGDHLGGFDKNYDNLWLSKLATSNEHRPIFTEYIIDERIKEKYPQLNLKFDLEEFLSSNSFKDFEKFKALNITAFRSTENFIENFVCSFNGTPHVSRILLVAALSKFGYLNDGYCTKNFTFDRKYIADIFGMRRFESLFFDYDIGPKIMSFNYTRFFHNVNYNELSPKVIKSFLHIVSETMATSYYPFITEKFLYSILTQGFFLAYAQPGWHDYLEKYLGFKKYSKIFDYSFDTIQDPIERLIALLTMISKFSNMNNDEWNFLYYLERETLQYNYNHYMNGKYISALKAQNQI